MIVYEHEFPGRKIRMKYNCIGDQTEIAKFATNVLIEFCNGFITLLAIDLSLSDFDKDYGFSIDERKLSVANWYLRVSDAPADLTLESRWNNSKSEDVPEIDDKHLIHWMHDVLVRANSPVDVIANSEVGIDQLAISAERIKLPFPEPKKQVIELSVHQASNVRNYGVEWENGSAFLNAPIDGRLLKPPVELIITNDSKVLTLDINVYLSLWTGLGSEGWQILKNKVDELKATGWFIASASIEGFK